MIPDLPNVSDPAMTAELLQPYNRVKVPLKDYARGGMALLDSSRGLNQKNWACEVQNGEVFLSADGVAATSVYDVDPDTSWISLAFDQNMHFNLAYVVGRVGYLYWYDAASQRYVTTNLGSVVTPFIRLDDVRLYMEGYSDIILSYIVNEALCVRVQRDRFSVEYVLARNAGTKIEQCGMNRVNRFQWNCG